MNSRLTLWMCVCVSAWQPRALGRQKSSPNGFDGGHTLAASVFLLSSFRLKWTACSSRVSIFQNPQLFWCLRPSFHASLYKLSVNSVNKTLTPPHYRRVLTNDPCFSERVRACLLISSAVLLISTLKYQILSNIERDEFLQYSFSYGDYESMVTPALYCKFSKTT